jgi:type VI secretion system protein VasJ
MSELDKIIERCIAPIGDQTPAGSSIRYDDLYDKIKNEIGSYSGAIQWNEVVNNSVEILSEKSKDINVAGFLTLGLFRQYGYKGLATGFHIYQKILSNFDDDYFPKIDGNEKRTMRVRKSALEWLNLSHPGKLIAFIRATPPGDQDGIYISDVLNEVRSIKRITDANFTPPVYYSSLLNTIGEYKSKVEATQTKEDSKAHRKKESQNLKDNPAPTKIKDSRSTEAIEQKTFAPSLGVKSRPTALPFEDKSIDELKKDLITIAKVLREKDATNPNAYRVLRAVKWDAINSLPDPKTTVPPKVSQRMKGIKNQFNSVEPQKAIPVLENSFSDLGFFGLWWLDLQRAIVQAMERSGPQYHHAAGGIRWETVKFIERFPEITNYVFKNGQPFADAETRVWLESLSRGQSDSSYVQLPVYDDCLADTMDQARQMASQENVSNALLFLQSQVIKAESKKNAFQFRLLASELCLEDGRVAEARFILEDLYRISTKVGLEEWDPPIFLQVCMLLNQIYKRLSCDGIRERAIDIQEKIIRLNMGFQITPNKV